MTTQKQINQLQHEINDNVEKHLAIANEEMSIIKNDIAWIKDAFSDAKKTLDKFDNRTWTILVTIIVGFLIQIFFRL